MSGLRQVGPLILLAAVCLPGCQPRQPFQTLLQSEDPSVRARACKDAGSSGDLTVAPLLVDRLEDPDCCVRTFANQALRELTRENFEFCESDPPDLKAKAVQRWRDYLNSQHITGRAGGPR